MKSLRTVLYACCPSSVLLIMYRPTWPMCFATHTHSLSHYLTNVRTAVHARCSSCTASHARTAALLSQARARAGRPGARVGGNPGDNPGQFPRLYDGRIHVPLELITAHFEGATYPKEVRL